MSETTTVLKVEEWIPEELQYIPIPYISLIGLRAESNAIHAMIWNAFTVNRGSERQPLYFKLLSDNYTFITSKPKKSSYEWHIPKGILKTSWLHKHLFEIPSVCVLFFELNWDDLSWDLKRAECVAKVEYLRRSLSQRNTKITLVLIQTSTHLPSDNSQFDERMAQISNSCDLTAKSLFVLPVSDVSQLMGYILRIESALYEFSRMYYQNKCKQIKGLRDQLNKTTHQLLYVRHEFKIAFFSELRQDQTTALKNYKNSYANLMEVRVTTTNLFEIKTIGGFISYKICKLCFQMNTPLEAISQFRKHIDIFRNKCEPKEIGFEHSAWLSMQNSLFGDLFDVAIMSGLIPSQIQNPGTYYIESALQARNRRKLFHSLCGDLRSEDLNEENKQLFHSLLHPIQQMEFFGQRPWRPGCQTLEPIDSEKERIGLRALKYKESNCDHSALIRGLLTNAINQFKKFKCPRMQRYLMVLVAEEYILSEDHFNALVFLNNVIPQYRREGWLPLIENILGKALRSSYLSADAINFVKLGLECIHSSKEFSVVEQIEIMDSIENIMRKEIPLLLSFVEKNESKKALQLWSNVLESTSEPMIFTIKMDSFITLIECKPKFTSNAIYCNESIELDLFLQSFAPKAIPFTKLNVLFSNQSYNQFCQLIDTSGNGLVLRPSKLEKFSFNITPLPEDIDRNVSIIGVNLSLGAESMSALLLWSFTDISNKVVFEDISHRWSDSIDIKHIRSSLTTNIMKPLPKLKFMVEHNSPALLNEFYSLKLLLKNKESFDISNVRISLNIFDPTSDDIPIDCQSLIFVETNFKELKDNYSLNDIKVNEEITEEIGIQFKNIGNHSIVFTISYDSTFEINGELKVISFTTTEKVSIDVLIPFFNTCELSNISLTKLSQIRTNEPFFMSVVITQNTGIPIEFCEIIPQFHESVLCLSQTNNLLRDNVFIDHTFKIICSTESSVSISLGIYLIKWKRKTNLNSLIAETPVPLPMTTIMNCPLFVDLKLPDKCMARNPVILCYNIHNRTESDLSLELSMGTSDNFMFSGNKFIQMVVSAKQSVEQHYILYPLVCGSILLPKFRIIMNTGTVGAVPIDYIDQTIPNQLFVFPQQKNSITYD